MKSMLHFTTLVAMGVLFFSSSCKKEDLTPLPNANVDTVQINFSDLTLSANSFWNGADNSGKFISGTDTFKNDYNSQYGSWSGFAYSNQHDLTTAGFANQFSAFVQETSSNIFAVGYASSTLSLTFTKPMSNLSFKVANTTYGALSMKNGDQYSKKFGGTNGTDPDWFKITIKVYKNNILKNSGDVFLADFTASDNSKDYILSTWKNLDLTSFGEIDAISFTLSSTDNADGYMNTPSYFCLDDIQGTVTK